MELFHLIRHLCTPMKVPNIPNEDLHKYRCTCQHKLHEFHFHLKPNKITHLHTLKQLHSTTRD
uniref:Putative ovule protein n=1 Tax=Solanum chacoense TaxID=4108 RepID=A0A0V0HN35_SOLCH